MKAYKDLSKEELRALQTELQAQYEKLKESNIKLDMSREKTKNMFKKECTAMSKSKTTIIPKQDPPPAMPSGLQIQESIIFIGATAYE